MSASMNTVLIVGGTSGIGENVAKRFHSMGKKVIITGRRKERLDELQKSMSGLETYAFDMTDFSATSSHIDKLFSTFPDIDTVWINGGMQHSSDVKDITSTTDERIVEEITLNFTAPTVIARHVIPRLLAQKTETHFMITSSGLGFAPVGSLFPVYCPTKAAAHHYLVGIRQALKDTNVNVLEIVPPYIETALGAEWQDKVKNATAMPMDEFVDEIFKILDGNKAKDLKEIAAGTAVPRVEAWRSGTGALLASSGLGG